MKSLYLPLLALVPAAHLGAATLYDFESSTAGNTFAGGGVSGWVQTGTNPDDNPLAYVSQANYFGGTTNVGVLGTVRANSPFSATTSVSASLANPGLPTLAGNQVSFDINIYNNPAYSVRDSFGVSISGLVSINFSPDASNANNWLISYEIGGTSFTSSYFVEADLDYSFYVSFEDGLASLGYAGVEIGSGAALVDSSTTWGDIEFSHTQTGFGTDPLGQSQNAIIFDNIAVVPEPSTALLAGLASLGLLRRRRLS